LSATGSSGLEAGAGAGADASGAGDAMVDGEWERLDGARHPEKADSERRKEVTRGRDESMVVGPVDGSRAIDASRPFVKVVEPQVGAGASRR
jgi:hypothetical protein